MEHTWHAGDQPQRPEDTKGSQSFDVEALDLERGKNGAHNPAQNREIYHFLMGLIMDEGTIKTPNPKCRLYWCLIDFID